MAFVELNPQINKPAADRITMTQRAKGGVTIAIGAETARRSKLVKGVKVRVLLDADGFPRKLRIVVDPKGPFAIAATPGGRAGTTPSGAVLLTIPALKDLPAIEQRVSVEWDEDTLDGHPILDLELPRALQRQATTTVQPTGNGRKPGGPHVTLPKVGGM
jgi:hypothetical protein